LSPALWPNELSHKHSTVKHGAFKTFSLTVFGISETI